MPRERRQPEQRAARSARRRARSARPRAGRRPDRSRGSRVVTTIADEQPRDGGRRECRPRFPSRSRDSIVPSLPTASGSCPATGRAPRVIASGSSGSSAAAMSRRLTSRLRASAGSRSASASSSRSASDAVVRTALRQRRRALRRRAGRRRASPPPSRRRRRPPSRRRRGGSPPGAARGASAATRKISGCGLIVPTRSRDARPRSASGPSRPPRRIGRSSAQAASSTGPRGDIGRRSRSSMRPDGRRRRDRARRTPGCRRPRTRRSRRRSDSVAAASSSQRSSRGGATYPRSRASTRTSRWSQLDLAELRHLLGELAVALLRPDGQELVLRSNGPQRAQTCCAVSRDDPPQRVVRRPARACSRSRA